MPKVEVIQVTAGLPKELEQAARGILKLHDQVTSRIAQGETKLVELQIRLDKAKTKEQQISLELRMRKVEEGVARERRALQQLVLEYNKARAAALRLGLAFDKLGREAPRVLTAGGPGGAMVLSGTRAIGPLGGTPATRQGVRVQGGGLGPFTGPVAMPTFARPGAGFPFAGFFGQAPPPGGGGFGGFPPGAGGPGGGGPLFPGGVITGATGRFLTQLLGVQLAASAIRKIFSDIVGGMKDAITEGVKMNALFETMRIGVAATLAQNAKITDQFGNQLTGLSAVNAALSESEKIQQKIVAAAFESGSGLDKFLEAFRIALPLALQMGAGLEDTVDVTKRLVLAANAIGIPFDLVRLQIDDILRGVVTTRTTLARVLGITQDILRPAREQGKVIDLVRAKTEAFLAAQEQIGNTFTVQTERAKLLGQVILKDVAQGAFLRLQEVLRAILKDLATVDKKTGEIKFDPALAETIEKLNVAFKDFVDLLVQETPTIITALSGVLNIVGRLVAGIGLLNAGLTAMSRRRKEVEVLRLEESASTRESKVASGRGSAVSNAEEKRLALEERLRAQKLRAEIQADEESIEAAKKFAVSVDEASSSVDKLSERLGQIARERSQGRGPTPAGGKITPVKTDSEIQAALAKEEADLEGRILEVKKKELEVDQKLADLGFTAVNLTSEQEEKERGKLRLRKADLAIEEALLRVESARRQVGLSGGGTVEQRERKQLNRALQELEKARGARDIEQKRTDEAVALGRLEDYRISQIQQRVQISQKELSIQTEIHDLDLRSSRMGEEEVAKRRAALRVAESEVRVQEAVLNLREKLAAAEAARFSESSQRRVTAQNDLRAAREALDKAVEDRSRARSAGEFGLSDAALRESDARRRLAATERSERVRREELSASSQLIAAERELLKVRERTSDFDVVALTTAENRLETERATLAVVVARARAAEALARLNDAGSRANELIAAGFSEQSNEMRAVRVEQERALSDLHAAELGVQEATADVERTRIDNQRRMIDAMRQQVGLAESLLSSFARLLGVMNSSLGATLQIMAAIREAVRGIKAAIAATKAQRKAQQGQSTGGGDDHEGDGSGLADAVASNENVANKTNKVTEAFNELFKSVEDFVKNGGIEALVSLGIAIHDAFGQGLGQGIGAAMQAVGSFIPGPVGAALQGAGAIVSLIGGMFTKGARKLAGQITKAINNTLNSFNAGTLNLGPAIAQLEKQRADAISRLSGKKGGQKELDKILPEIDSAIAQLKRQQKELFEAFDKELKILRLPDQFRDIGKSIEELNEKIRAFLDAGGSYLKAQEFLARSLQDIFRDASRTLRDDELEVIDLLQREIDLHKAREEAINDAAKAERDVRARLGITRPLTPAQEAAIQIREIRRRRDERVEEIDRELQLVDAQLEGRRELYELGLSEEELFARRLDLTRQETAEIRERIRLIQEFLQQNAAAFAAAFASHPPGTSVPNTPFFNGGQFVPGGITVGTVVVNPYPGMSPQEAWDIVREGMEYGARRPWAVLT